MQGTTPSAKTHSFLLKARVGATLTNRSWRSALSCRLVGAPILVHTSSRFGQDLVATRTKNCGFKEFYENCHLPTFADILPASKTQRFGRPIPLKIHARTPFRSAKLKNLPVQRGSPPPTASHPLAQTHPPRARPLVAWQSPAPPAPHVPPWPRSALLHSPPQCAQQVTVHCIHHAGVVYTHGFHPKHAWFKDFSIVKLVFFPQQ